MADSMISPATLIEFSSQEAALAHLAKPVIDDYERAKRQAATPEQAFNNLAGEYFTNSKFGRLWLLNCLYKLEEHEDE